MEEFLVTAVGYLRLVVEAIGAAVVGFGALAAAATALTIVMRKLVTFSLDLAWRGGRGPTTG
jgi:hypothetical protein